MKGQSVQIEKQQKIPKKDKKHLEKKSEPFVSFFLCLAVSLGMCLSLTMAL